MTETPRGPGERDPAADWGWVPERPRTSRSSRSSTAVGVAGVVLACWLVGVLVHNVDATGRAAGLIDHLFPRFGGGSQVDTASVNRAWDIVRQEYVYKDVDAGDGTAGAEQGIIQALKDNPKYKDRFSSFFTSAEYAQLQGDLSGKRSGSIGVTLEARCPGPTPQAPPVSCPTGQTATVVALESVLRGQPADHAGLRNGDILVSVAGRPVAGLGPDASTRLDMVGPLIRGPAMTTVSITIDRGGRMITATVEREDLQIPTVYSQRFGRTLYLEVSSFGETTGNDFHSALKAGLDGGATAVVLDLRANPGGLVSESQAVASEFLVPDAQHADVVVRRGRLNSSADPSSADSVEHDVIKPDGLDPKGPVAVLVDGNSASAAEIVAAALHDYHRATVVGAKTFGKGSVQQDFTLPDGNDLHLTVQKWFGPAGESIDGTGLDPDMAVALGADSRFELDAQSAPATGDAQLQAALRAVQPAG